MQNLSNETPIVSTITGKSETAQAITTQPHHTITKRIGTTNYIVGIYFNTNAEESISDKILRLIKNDIASGA